MNIIELKNLGHRFGNGNFGLDGVNLSIKKGSFVVICGRNGSGKTTLLKHLNGLLFPDTGTVMLNGFSVAENPVKARQMAGMVFQDSDSQIVGETVYDDVAFGPENLNLNRLEIQKRVNKALKAVDMVDFAHRKTYLLSGGEKRRLAIAGVLAMEPVVIIFDEPFSNLDYPGVRQVVRQILTLHQKGHTIIVAAHDLEEFIRYADRLVIMDKGKVVKNCLPREIKEELETYGIKTPYALRTKNQKKPCLK